MSNTSYTNNEDITDKSSNNTGIAILLIIILIVAMPIVALSALATWLTFAVGRIRRSVITVALFIYLILTGIFLPWGIQQFINSYTQTIPEGIKHSTWGSMIGTALLQQILVSIPLGMALGIIYIAWTWFHRERWVEYTFRKTPWEIWRERKTINDIANDKNTPYDGVTLGVNTHTGERVVQTDRAAISHTAIIGTTGSGKTTTLMGECRDSIKRGLTVIYIDVKGGEDVPRILHNYAQRYGRTFKHWLLQPPTRPYTGPSEMGPAYYDPISRGDATRRKELLINIRAEWEEYYKGQSENILQTLFNVLIENPDPNVSTLDDVVALLDLDYLDNRAAKLARDPKMRSIVAAVHSLRDSKSSKEKRSVIDGLRAMLETILNSVAGRWLTIDRNNPENNINLFESAHKGEVIVFSLDSSNYESLSKNVANLIVQDLKTVSSELRLNPVENQVKVIIDEFASIDAVNIIGFINKSRDANLATTLATQALADLRATSNSLQDQIFGIINNFIIHTVNLHDDAEFVAGLTGMTTKTRFTQTVVHERNLFSFGKGAGAGRGQVQEYETTRVDPTILQQLPTGHMVYVSKRDDEIIETRIIPEKGISTGYNGPAPRLANDTTAEYDANAIFNTEEETLDNNTSTPNYATLPQYTVSPEDPRSFGDYSSLIPADKDIRKNPKPLPPTHLTINDSLPPVNLEKNMTEHYSTERANPNMAPRSPKPTLPNRPVNRPNKNSQATPNTKPRTQPHRPNGQEQPNKAKPVNRPSFPTPKRDTPPVRPQQGTPRTPPTVKKPQQHKPKTLQEAVELKKAQEAKKASSWEDSHPEAASKTNSMPKNDAEAERRIRLEQLKERYKGDDE